MQITDNGRPLSQSDWLNIEVYLLGIDNSAYHVHTGIFERIGQNIRERLASDPALAPLKRAWTQQGMLMANGDIAPRHRSYVFSHVADFYRQQGKDALANYLHEVYQADYSAIPPQPEFVEAVEALREDGKKVALYSESPFGEFNGRIMHVNKTLEAIGFAPDAFGENDVVDLIKIDRMPELAAGYSAEQKPNLFRKSTRQGFVQTCNALGISPVREGFPHVAYLGDSATHFSDIQALGVNRILIGACEKPLAQDPDNAHAQLKIWQNTRDDTGRYFSTAGCLLAHVAALKPIRPRARKYSTKTAFSGQSNRPGFNPALVLE